MASGKCAACSEEFSGLTAFDKHQTTDYGSPKPVTCHDPASVGLVRDRNGRWGFPATEASRDYFASMRAEREAPGVPATPQDHEAAESATAPHCDHGPELQCFDCASDDEMAAAIPPFGEGFRS
jgi:hypothetical protein